MILTVTLNPAVDKFYTVEALRPGRLVRVKTVNNTAGGKGLNVSRVAALCGQEVCAAGFVGGYNGQYLCAMLAGCGVRAAFTRTEGETRSCINIREEATGLHTEILEPGAPLSQKEMAAFLKDFATLLPRADVVTVSGSLPAGAPSGTYAALVRAAREYKTPVIVDAGGEALRLAAAACPAMIKPNADEMVQLAGKAANTRDGRLAAARALHRGGIDTVVVSLGREGALMVCADGDFLGVTPDVPVVNTVGSGDAMVAGFAVGIARGLTPPQQLKLATAAATANAMNRQTGYFEMEDFKRLEETVEVIRI